MESRRECAASASKSLQSNELQNRILQFGRGVDRTLVPVASVLTGGAGSDEFKPVSGQESAPNAFEGAGSVILAEGKRLLFAMNGGDNTVSSFRVGEDGTLTRIDIQSAGEPITGLSGTAPCASSRPRAANCRKAMLRAPRRRQHLENAGLRVCPHVLRVHHRFRVLRPQSAGMAFEPGRRHRLRPRLRPDFALHLGRRRPVVEHPAQVRQRLRPTRAPLFVLNWRFRISDMD